MYFFITAILVLILDQVSKLWISHSMSLHQSNAILGNFFRLNYRHNPYSAFSLNLGGRTFLTVVAIIAIIIVLAFYWRYRKLKHYSIALGLLLGGAIGNLIDRIRLGEVIDFLDVGIGTTRWPTFNVADAAITIGVGMLFVFILLEDLHSKKSTKESIVIGQ